MLPKEEYFIRLSTLINAVRYLLHQGLAFRGHNESEDSANRGNFLELVKLLAEQNEKNKEGCTKKRSRESSDGVSRNSKGHC
jgi:hypothetical protein